MEARAAQPPPPRFYKLYAGGADAGPPPPEAIAGGEFQQYGTSYSLGEQGGEGDAAGPAREVTPAHEAVARIRALNRETLFAFIEVVDAVASRPSDSQRAQEVLRECTSKMATLLSALRSTQALLEIRDGYKNQSGAGKRTEAFFGHLAELLRPLAGA
mmetsp:Transcript_7529/g.25887  ORF Transcript_7529/g.25887 Transcript_7529/m.25887 type:complete len:158 (-) Transcript_7529:126-599(-)